jgi:hypothetical protein
MQAACCPTAGRRWPELLQILFREILKKPANPPHRTSRILVRRDLTAGYILKVVEPIFRAGAAPDAQAVETEFVDLKSFARFSRNENGLVFLKNRLIYIKEEINIFDRNAPSPSVPPRLTDLLALARS